MSIQADDSIAWALPAPVERRRGWVNVAIPLAVVPLVTVLDVATGSEISLAAFYLVGVIVGTWRGGRVAGSVIAAASALGGLSADLLISEPYMALFDTSYSSPWIPIWNAIARWAVYGFAVFAVATLQDALAERDRAARDLQRALADIRTLEGLLPVCAWCKRIRDEEDAGAWKPIERYVAQHTNASFTHGICPDCVERVHRDSLSAR